MASSLHFPLLIIAALSLLISPSLSLTCTSQKFKNGKSFANCTDLPVLGAHLHFTYNSSNSSLSIAFVAPPVKPEGWVAWGINPTSTGMVGTQAMIAFKSKGAVLVKTLNISSYSSVEEAKLAFDVWDLSAESDGDNLVIFGSAKVPAKAEKLNQVWQVGPLGKNGIPEKHAFAEENKKSTGILSLVQAHDGGPVVPAPAPSWAPPTADAAASSRAGRWSTVASWVGLIVLLGSVA